MCSRLARLVTRRMFSDCPAHGFYRDAKSLQVVEGTSNIQKIIISGMACGHTPNRE